jgi:glycosyltransferase 2 family protein
VRARKIKIVLRIVATMTLLAVLFWRADSSAIIANLGRVQPMLLLTAVLLMALRNLALALRWGAMLRTWETVVRVGPLARLVLIGHFFNLLLPTSSGGDLARWDLLARRGGGRTLAAQSVVADRMIGLVGLGLLLLAVLPWSWALVPGGWVRVVLLLGAPVTVAGLIAVLEPRWVPARWRDRLQLEPARRSRWIPAATALSLLNHLLAVGMILTLGRAVGDDTSVRVYATLLPIIWLASMLPITIGGLGVREAGFVALFTAAGMGEMTATTIAGLWLAMTLAQAATGGVLMLVMKREPQTGIAGLRSTA